MIAEDQLLRVILVNPLLGNRNVCARASLSVVTFRRESLISEALARVQALGNEAWRDCSRIIAAT